MPRKPGLQRLSLAGAINAAGSPHVQAGRCRFLQDDESTGKALMEESTKQPANIVEFNTVVELVSKTVRMREPNR